MISSLNRDEGIIKKRIVNQDHYLVEIYFFEK